MVLGITGKIGSGKTTIINIIANNKNVKIINLDDIAKDVLRDKNINLKSIAEEGKFLSIEELDFQKKYIHPLVWEKVKQIVHDSHNDYDMILIETALPNDVFFDITDKTILVKSNKIYDYLKANRNYSDNLISEILKAQSEYDDYYNKCDVVINNDNEIENIKNELIKTGIL